MAIWEPSSFSNWHCSSNSSSRLKQKKTKQCAETMDTEYWHVMLVWGLVSRHPKCTQHATSRKSHCERILWIGRESIKTMSHNERQQQSVGALVKTSDISMLWTNHDTCRIQSNSDCYKDWDLLTWAAESPFDLCDWSLSSGRCQFRQHFRSGMKLAYQLSSIGIIHVLTGNTLDDPSLCKRSTCKQGFRCLACLARPAMVPAQD